MANLDQFLLTSKSVLCGHCGNNCPMFIICEGERHLDDDEGMIYFDWKWQILLCSSCHEVVVLEHSSNSEHEYPVMSWNGEEIWESDISTKCLYPSNRHKFENLPHLVAKSYATAVRLMTFEPTACAIFIGRTLEFLCQDRQAQGKTLDQMLKDLAYRKEIPESILEMALSLKFFRNIGAHASDIEISKEDATILVEICEVILEYVYEASYMLEQVKERIKKIKNKA